MKSHRLGILCVCVGLAAVVPSFASAGEANSMAHKVLKILDEVIDMRDFQNPMTLKEALGLLHNQMTTKKLELSLLLDASAFRETNLESNPYETQVTFGPFPRTMTLGTALKHAIDQIPGGNGTFLIRKGRVEITTTECAKLDRLLDQKIAVQLNNETLAEALGELSGVSGVSIIVDPRIKDQAKVKVTATFRNDVTLAAALRILCDMAEVRFVDVGGGIYVTTPANAEKLNSERPNFDKSAA